MEARNLNQWTPVHWFEGEAFTPSPKCYGFDTCWGYRFSMLKSSTLRENSGSIVPDFQSSPDLSSDLFCLHKNIS